MAATANLELANTFNQWRTTINEVILKVNNLENGNADLVIDTLVSNTTNTIVSTANNTFNVANAAWFTANAAYSTANAAYAQANTANTLTDSNTVFKTSYNVVTTKDSYSATINYNLNDGRVFYQTNLSGNITANFVGVKNTGSVVTKAEVIIEQGGTPYIINAVQTDGTSRTIEWRNNTVPSGNSNAVDLMTFTIIKDANSVFTVLGSLDTHG